MNGGRKQALEKKIVSSSPIPPLTSASAASKCSGGKSAPNTRKKCADTCLVTLAITVSASVNSFPFLRRRCEAVRDVINSCLRGDEVTIRCGMIRLLTFHTNVCVQTVTSCCRHFPSIRRCIDSLVAMVDVNRVFAGQSFNWPDVNWKALQKIKPPVDQLVTCCRKFAFRYFVVFSSSTTAEVPLHVHRRRPFDQKRDGKGMKPLFESPASHLFSSTVWLPLRVRPTRRRHSRDLLQLVRRGGCRNHVATTGDSSI